MMTALAPLNRVMEGTLQKESIDLHQIQMNIITNQAIK